MPSGAGVVITLLGGNCGRVYAGGHAGTPRTELGSGGGGVTSGSRPGGSSGLDVCAGQAGTPRTELVSAGGGVTSGPGPSRPAGSCSSALAAAMTRWRTSAFSSGLSLAAIAANRVTTG